MNVIPTDINQKYEQIWISSGVGEKYALLLNKRLDSLVEELNSFNLYDPDNYFDKGEFKASLEMSAYTIAELLAQLCSGGMTWQMSDKTRFLPPTVDLVNIVRKRATGSQIFDYWSEYFTSVELGNWDFLKMSERTHSWFEAFGFTNDNVAYLLWSSYKALQLLRANERVPGFTILALTNKDVLEMFCKCESPIESILYMQLVVDGLLPPTLQTQWPVDNYRLDFAIPIGRVAIECDGVDYHDEEQDAIRDRELAQKDWVVLRFSGKEILKNTYQCSYEIHDQYPWRRIPRSSNDSDR